MLSAARTRLDDEAKRGIRQLLGEPLDWDHLLDLATEHMVLPLVHRTIREVAPDAPPVPVQRRLRSGLHANVRRNLILAHALVDLLALFAQHDIPVVSFKGPVAAAAVYGDLQLRSFGDLDILVQTDDVLRARALLLDHEFGECRPLAAHFDQPPSWYLSLSEPLSKAEGYVRAPAGKDPIPVDLHWDLTPRYFRHSLDRGALWDRLRTVSLLDTDVRTLSAEDTLLHFCLHGTIHRWERLRLVCDVAELLRRHDALQWDLLLDRASQTHSERIILLGLRLAHELLDAPLPPRVRNRVYSNRAVASLTQRVAHRLFNRPQGLSRIWNAYTHDLQVRDRLVDGLALSLYHTRLALWSSFQTWWAPARP